MSWRTSDVIQIGNVVYRQCPSCTFLGTLLVVVQVGFENIFAMTEMTSDAGLKAGEA